VRASRFSSIEELIDSVFFDPDVCRQHVVHEPVGHRCCLCSSRTIFPWRRGGSRSERCGGAAVRTADRPDILAEKSPGRASPPRLLSRLRQHHS